MALSSAAEFVETMLGFAEMPSDVLAYLKTWYNDGSGTVAGVVVRDEPIVQKTETESIVVVFNRKGCLGWLRGKEAKVHEEWEKQFPGQTEKVWVIPETFSNWHPLASPEIVNSMAAWVRQHPHVRAGIQNPNRFQDQNLADRFQAAAKETAQPQMDLIAKEIADAESGEPHIKPKNVKPSSLKRRKKAEKKPKVKPDRSLRTMFRQHLAELDLKTMIEEWMYSCDLRIIDDPEDLQRWVNEVLADTSRHRLDPLGQRVPIIATDCETIGLDNRIIVDVRDDGSLVYEIKAEIAGLCLASHGMEGVYVPINHDRAKNMKREDVRRILQPLFDVAHLVFYNAKFDREILRLCLGIVTRPYPHFEDVQVLQFDNDPKADMDDQKKGKTFLSDAGGLKALTEHMLGIKQIKLEKLIKVKAAVVDKVACKCKHPVSEHGPKCGHQDCKCEAFVGKETLRVQYAPFHWLPVEIARYYAAPDATCTWRLWEKTIHPARERTTIHRVDHRLVDAITWIERQRFLIDTKKHAEIVKWHQGKLHYIEKNLQAIAEKDGWPVKRDDEGNILEGSEFNVNSNPQVGTLLYTIRKMPIINTTETGKASTNAETLTELGNLYPNDPFLTEYANYKEYVALHPENLRTDPKDDSARVYFRQNVVAGGRLAASGGEFDVDGGFELNPQGIKKTTDQWFVKGRILTPDFVKPDDVEPHDASELHPSCKRGDQIAPDIIKNHIGNYSGYAICLVPTCTTCAEKFGILIEDGKADANEVLNMRCLFVSKPGWTFFSVDYSNIEMRAAANASGEPRFVSVFTGDGDGDFHAMTARAVFPEYTDPATPKERKKYLRGLAKILNFALLYGGTESTVCDNLQKQDRKTPREELMKKAKDMFDTYWKSVPVFAEFCQGKQFEAREGPLPANEPVWNPDALYHHGDKVQYDPTGAYAKGMRHRVYQCVYKGFDGVHGGGDPEESPYWMKAIQCTTAMGRVVNFVSQMEAEGIHRPLKAEQDNYRQYQTYRNLAAKTKDAADTLRINGDKEGAKRFAEEAKQYETLSQQLWTNEESGVKNCIDWNRFQNKATRVAVNTPLQGLAGDFMRLSLTKICDFATNQHPLVQSIFRLHGTIHDEIVFSVKNEYVPYLLPRITRIMKLRRLHEIKKWSVPIECNIEYGHSWDVSHHVIGDKEHTPVCWTKIEGLENYVPELYRESVEPMLAALAGGDDQRAVVERWLKKNIHPHGHNAIENVMKAKDAAAQRQALVVVLQLHEYWCQDTVPDEEGGKLESFLDYEKRVGLGPQDRDPLFPPFGYLGTVPPDAFVIRPKLEPLELQDGTPVALDPQPVPMMPPEAASAQQTLFTAVQPPAPVVLKELSDDGEMERLLNALGKGQGTHEVVVIYRGQRIPLRNCARTEVPEEFRACPA